MKEFDSSDKRGTGQPYALTLGRGDVVRGLDLAMYDMCIGERRRVEVNTVISINCSFVISAVVELVCVKHRYPTFQSM
jgi:FKBP-type peptidyl-prolyl cis-trans isomerase